MTATVKQLVQDFARELRAAAREQLLEEMYQFAAARRANVARARSVRPKRRRPKRRRQRSSWLDPFVTVDSRAAAAATAADRAAAAAARLAVPAAAAPFETRAVVVRIDGGPSKIALLVGAPAPGFFVVRLAQGRGKYSPKRRRILASELLRDATPRELELGYVVPGVTS